MTVKLKIKMPERGLLSPSLPLLLLLLLFPTFTTAAASTADVTRIAFGSCSKVDEPQPMWDTILGTGTASHPDVFVWAGDNVYADNRSSSSSAAGRPLQPGERPRFAPRSAREHADMYAAQRRVPGYAHLLASGIPVVGTWDDHDAGINDADRFFAHKDERQQLHLDFLDVPAASPRRRRKGVYNAFTVGAVKIILLDVRYHRDPWPWHPGALDPLESDILGEEQWAWLERELGTGSGGNENREKDEDEGDDDEKNGAAVDLYLVVSGFQVVPVVLASQNKHETWWHFPAARRRLAGVLARANAPVLILSGDVHFAEISECVLVEEKEDDEADEKNSGPGRLLEFTSSGLTHAWAGSGWNWPKPLPAAVLFRYAWHFWNTFGPSPWRLEAFPGMNYGEVVVDHARREVEMRVIDQRRRARVTMRVGLEELVGGKRRRETTGSGTPELECRPVHGMPSALHIRLAMAGMVLGPVSVFFLAVAASVRGCWAVSRRRRVWDATAEKKRA